MPFRVGSEILETFEEKRSFAPETIRSIHDDLPQITASEQNDIPECKSLLEISSAHIWYQLHRKGTLPARFWAGR